SPSGGYIVTSPQLGAGSVVLSWVTGPAAVVTLSSSANPALYDTPVTFTATITAPQGAPACVGCSVAFTYTQGGEQGPPIGSAAVGADWKAASVPVQLPPGDALVTATFTGSGYSTSSGSLTQTTRGYSLASDPPQVPYQNGFRIVATPAPGTTLPSGITVTDSDGSVVCNVVEAPYFGCGNTWWSSADTAGTHTWTVVDDTSNRSAPFPMTFVEQVPTMSASTTPSLLVGDEPFVVNATVMPSAAHRDDATPPEGTVTVRVDGAFVGSYPLDKSGKVVSREWGEPFGTYPLVVDYSGVPGKWAPVGSTTTLDVKDPDVQIALSASSNPVEVGQPVTYTATVTVPPDRGPCPDCAVTFLIGPVDHQKEVTVPVGPDTGWKATTEYTWPEAGAFPVKAFLNHPPLITPALIQTVQAAATGTPPEAGQQLTDLAAAATGLGPGGHLQRLVEQAHAHHDAGRSAAACGLMQGFGTQVEAYGRTGLITPAQTADLTTRSTGVRTELGCPGR
ncbi:MAG: hypothetical protein L0I76_24475, partial [Pseudonocardia sp.]|nr:hypothetical protein [Pseudonocardia sp.]